MAAGQMLKMLDEDLNSSTLKFRPITYNESVAYRKNKVQESLLGKRVKLMQKFTELQCMDIKYNQKVIANSFPEIITSTGYLSRKGQIKSAPSKIQSSEVNKPATPFMKNVQTLNRAHSEITISKQATKVKFGDDDDDDKFTPAHSIVSVSSVDSSPPKQPAKSNGAVGLGRAKSSTAALNTSEQGGGDKKVSKKLAELENQRRTNAHYRLQQRIERLKQLDPVFAKRYKQFLTAKNQDKAPVFDRNDHYIASNVMASTSVLARAKNEIIRQASQQRAQKSHTSRVEVSELDLRVKKFVQEFSVF